jgi:hypothetical protein
VPTCPLIGPPPSRQDSLPHHMLRARDAPQSTIIRPKGALRAPPTALYDANNHMVRANSPGLGGCAILGSRASWTPWARRCLCSACTHLRHTSTGAAGGPGLGESTSQLGRVTVCAWGRRSHLYCNIELSPSPTAETHVFWPYCKLAPSRARSNPHRPGQGWFVPISGSGRRGMALIKQETSV